VRLTLPQMVASLRTLAIACALWGGGCAKTGITPPCPLGYALDGITCLCSTDQGCPVGMGCQDGLCVCRSNSCCPTGYQYSSVFDGCFCRASSCCPRDHIWREDVQKCTCGSQSCCPRDYLFDAAAEGCRCAATSCCPQGFRYNEVAQKCACDSDLCCPVDYQFDDIRKDCVCARDACCPSGYRYNDRVRACVCVSDACCPPGYRQDPAGERCICTPAACTTGQFCDSGPGGSGACRCLSDAGCRPGQFCNPLGFCQSLAGCTANTDCPPGTFCDVTTDTCIANGPCTLDEQCAFGQLCDPVTRTCRAGCRRDSDCALVTPVSQPRQACISGQCQNYCRDNNGCPVNLFCDTGGTCSARTGRADCRDCQATGTCPPGSDCLVFINEGQTRRFCGMRCNDEPDCPSGYDCGSVIYGCPREGDECQADSGPNRCSVFLVENEVRPDGTLIPQLYCAEVATGRPHVYFKSCAPISGFCPAEVLP